MFKLCSTTQQQYVTLMSLVVVGQERVMTYEIWFWALEKNVLLSARHIPGAENGIADE